MYKPLMGSQNLFGKSNENGRSIIEMATELNLRIMGTFFNINKETWSLSDGRTLNQIDHLLIEAHDVKFVKDLTTIW